MHYYFLGRWYRDGCWCNGSSNSDFYQARPSRDWNILLSACPDFPHWSEEIRWGMSNIVIYFVWPEAYIIKKVAFVHAKGGAWVYSILYCASILEECASYYNIGTYKSIQNYDKIYPAQQRKNVQLIFWMTTNQKVSYFCMKFCRCSFYNMIYKFVEDF